MYELQTAGSLEHQFVTVDAKTLHFQAQYFHFAVPKVHSMTESGTVISDKLERKRFSFIRVMKF